MPRGVVKTKQDEEDWARAKGLAAKEGYAKNYGYIMRIYKRIKKGRRK